jgi:excisionase family DNA binding protein
MLSLSEAAAETGIAKTTIWRAIKAGRIAATKTIAGFRIDPEELFRVFPRASAPAKAQLERDDMVRERVAIVALESHIAALKEANSFLRETLAQTRRDRDAWRVQAEATKQLLADAPRLHRLFGLAEV